MNIDIPGRIIARKAVSIGASVTHVRRDLRALRIAATVLVIIAVLALCAAAAGLLAPTAIAITLALVLAPVARALERLGFPGGVASVVAVLSTVTVLGAAAAALAPEAADLLGRAPSIAQTIERKLRPITRQIAAFERASSQIGQSGPASATPSGGAAGAGRASAVTCRERFQATCSFSPPSISASGF